MERVHLSDRGPAADPGAEREPPWGTQKWQQWQKQFLQEQSGCGDTSCASSNAAARSSRELEHHAARADERTVWWGTRAQMTWMLELLHSRGGSRSPGG